MPSVPRIPRYIVRRDAPIDIIVRKAAKRWVEFDSGRTVTPYERES